MPTELSATLARRRETRMPAPTEPTIMLGCAIVYLSVLVLLFADKDFAQSLQFAGLY